MALRSSPETSVKVLLLAQNGLGGEEGFELKNNHSVEEAILVCGSLGTSININQVFKHNGKGTAAPVDSVLELPEDLVPKSLPFDRASGAPHAAVAAASSAAPVSKKPRRGGVVQATPPTVGGVAVAPTAAPAAA